jgi:hypothetical protein
MDKEDFFCLSLEYVKLIHVSGVKWSKGTRYKGFRDSYSKQNSKSYHLLPRSDESPTLMSH